MAKSKNKTAKNNLTELFNSTLFNKPQFPFSAITATPTAIRGKKRRKRNVLKNTSPRLLSHLNPFETVRALLGPTCSQKATAMNIPKKKPALIAASLSKKYSFTNSF